MTPHQQHHAAIRREWATWRGISHDWAARSLWYVAEPVCRSLARDYAHARALRAYLRDVGDNE